MKLGALVRQMPEKSALVHTPENEYGWCYRTRTDGDPMDVWTQIVYHDTPDSVLEAALKGEGN